MKKNLIILLLIPFLIALLGVVTLNTTFKYIDNDILSIEWDYDDIEAFKISDGLYPLEAKGVNEKNYPAGAGNQLTWTVSNADINDETVYAEIIQQGTNYFLKTYLEGNVVITCSNEKGNVFRSMNAIIYKNGAIIVQTDVRSSQNNVDPIIYYGEYDLDGNKKKNAVIDLDIKVIPSSYQENLKVESISDNIEFNVEKQQINVLSKGDASLVLSIGDDAVAKPFEFKFNVVENGINVYSYNDLLACTNKSTNGEIVVLRKSFESLDNAFVYNDEGNLVLDGAGKPVLKSNNVECFGNYDVKSKSFNFANEIYSFKTTYNYEYIRQWNEYMARIGSKNTISTAVKAGLRMVLWGFESGSKKIMKLINKGIDIDKRLDILRTAREAGIYNFAFIFFGFPAETRRDALKTIKVICDNTDIINSYGKSVFTMGKHTKLREAPEKYGVVGETKQVSEFSPTYEYNAVGMTKQELNEMINLCTKRANNAYGNALSFHLLSREILFLYLCKYGVDDLCNYKLS